MFPVLEELQIGYVAFSPLTNGFLSAKYGKDSAFDRVYDYQSMMPQFSAAPRSSINKSNGVMSIEE